MTSFEQGPIRPPSEAFSLLVRISRNCPWNRCAFCPVYKGEKFSLRPADEVLADLDAMRATFGDRPRTVFLQDANPLLTRPDDLVRILEGIRARFPRVERITAYARAHTLAIRSLTDLRRLRAAGLDRLHVGLESGADAVLKLVDKGVTRARQIEGGQRAKAAGFELSEYVMPGLGGARLSDLHADETASALVAIRPDFVRLRTLAVIPGTPLAALEARGEFIPLGEVDTVCEIQRFLLGLGTLPTRLESDHMLNLLGELRGDLPADRARLLGLLDDFLALPADDRRRFILARRLGMRLRSGQLDDPALRGELDRVLARLEAEGMDAEALFAEMRTRMV
ncbi:MAG: radical SAM protein [Planctomycetes bacterium]|nr:radical SAM protein [Planctomycetota bacterium]